MVLSDHSHIWCCGVAGGLTLQQPHPAQPSPAAVSGDLLSGPAPRFPGSRLLPCHTPVGHRGATPVRVIL